MASSARARAYEVIHRGIANGEYPPGSWVREEDLAAAAGVSRTPVREALHRLQAEGLVEILPNRGALVVGWTAQDLDDLYELRVLVEGYGVRRAAALRYAVDFPALHALCDEMDRLLGGGGEEELERLGQLCIDFHHTLHRASGNRQLLGVLPMLIGRPFVRQAFQHHTRAELERAFAYHREIVEALEAGDADWAEGIMRAHLRTGRLSLRRMELQRAPDDEAAAGVEAGAPDADRGHRGVRPARGG